MRWTSKPNIISERKETIEMRIQHNIMAMNAYRNYANNTFYFWGKGYEA